MGKKHFAVQLSRHPLSSRTVLVLKQQTYSRKYQSDSGILLLTQLERKDSFEVQGHPT